MMAAGMLETDPYRWLAFSSCSSRASTGTPDRKEMERTRAKDS